LLCSSPLKHQNLLAKDFDWALHPGGIAILKGAEQKLNLTKDHLRASYDVYKNHGNSSSATVLVVLDRLRKMGNARDNIVACSFGPGMSIEMAMLSRCITDSSTGKDWWGSKY
jgi:predicted naringenin-chalcone synthase